jgi:hypothetical protein
MDAPRRFVPGHSHSFEVRGVGHVATDRSVVAEVPILDRRLASCARTRRSSPRDRPCHCSGPGRCSSRPSPEAPTAMAAPADDPVSTALRTRCADSLAIRQSNNSLPGVNRPAVCRSASSPGSRACPWCHRRPDARRCRCSGCSDADAEVRIVVERVDQVGEIAPILEAKEPAR